MGAAHWGRAGHRYALLETIGSCPAAHSGDLLAPVLAEEPGQLIGVLELGDVAVEEDAVDRLVLEEDAVIE